MKKIFVVGALALMCLSTMVVTQALDEEAATRLDSCREPIGILDSLAEQEPRITYVIHRTAQAARKVQKAIAAETEADNEMDEAFLEEQKLSLLKHVEQFLGIAHENGSMLTPIIEACLGEKSVYLAPFFAASTDEAEGYFNRGVTSVDELSDLADEVGTVCGTLFDKEVLVKAYPVYKEFVAEKKKAQAGAEKKKTEAA